MTSILKVDTIQTAAGGTPTLASLGLTGTGTVLQVKTTSFSNQISTTSTTLTDISSGGNSLSVTITPSSASNRLLIMVMLAAEIFDFGVTDFGFAYNIYQNGTAIYEADYTLYHSNIGGQQIDRTTPIVEVAAGTTSPITISMKYASTRPGVTARINAYGSPSIMTVIEIAG